MVHHTAGLISPAIPLCRVAEPGLGARWLTPPGEAIGQRVGPLAVAIRIGMETVPGENRPASELASNVPKWPNTVI